MKSVLLLFCKCIHVVYVRSLVWVHTYMHVSACSHEMSGDGGARLTVGIFLDCSPSSTGR